MTISISGNTQKNSILPLQELYLEPSRTSQMKLFANIVSS